MDKPEDVDLEICKLDDLEREEHKIDITVRAYDTLSNVTEALLDSAAPFVRQVKDAGIAFLPYGQDFVRSASDGIMDALVDEIGSDTEVGSFSYVFTPVEDERAWQRAPNSRKWIRYRFVAFWNRDENQSTEEEKQKELYVAVFRLSLTARAAAFDGIPVPGPETNYLHQPDVPNTDPVPVEGPSLDPNPITVPGSAGASSGDPDPNQ